MAYPTLSRKLLIGLSRGYASLIGAAMVIGTSLVYYFYYYKYHGLWYALFGGLFLGYFIMQMSMMGALSSARRYYNGYRRNSSAKQSIVNFLGIITMVTLVIVTDIKLIAVEQKREADILANQPAAVTTARVTEITTTSSKGTTYYRAHLKYVANGRTILQDTPDDRGYLKAGETCELKYSLQYPEMFEIYGK